MKSYLGLIMAVVMLFSVINIPVLTVEADVTSIILDEDPNNNEPTAGTVVVTGSPSIQANSDGYGGYISYAPKSSTVTVKYMPRLEEGVYTVYLHKNLKVSGYYVFYRFGHKYSSYINDQGQFNWGKDYKPFFEPDENGDWWYPLGTYAFSGDYGADYLELSNTEFLETPAYQNSYFDAVKFERQPDKTVIIDDKQNENDMGSVDISSADPELEPENIPFHANGGGGIAGYHRQLNLTKVSAPVTFTYYPKLEAGEYEVFINRPRINSTNPNMTASVTYAGGTENVSYNIKYTGVSDQTAYQGDENWFSVGAYSFTGVYGQDNVQVTSSGSSGTARWDAVKFVWLPKGDNSVVTINQVADNNNVGTGWLRTSGSYTESENELGFGGKICTATSYTKNAVKFTYLPRLDEGLYRIYLHKNYKAYGSLDFTVNHKYSSTYPEEEGSINWGLDYAESVEEDENGDKWYPIGSYYFEGIYGKDCVTFVTTGKSPGYFDAVRFEKEDAGVVIIDEWQSENDLGKVEVTGAALTDFTESSYGIGGLSRTVNLSGYESPIYFKYLPRLQAGTYKVFVNRPRVIAFSNAAMAASVTHSGGTDSIYYSITTGNDIETHENWYPLGMFNFSGVYGQDYVEIYTADTDLGESKGARWDAVKFVPASICMLEQVTVNGVAISNGGNIPRGTDSFILQFDEQVPAGFTGENTIYLVNGLDEVIDTSCQVNGNLVTVNLKASLDYNTVYSFHNDPEGCDLDGFSFITNGPSDTSGNASVDVISSGIIDGTVGISGTVLSSANIGIAGRTVSLYDGQDALVGTAVSGDNGVYNIDYQLPSGSPYGTYSFTVGTEYCTEDVSVSLMYIDEVLKEEILAAFNSAVVFKDIIRCFSAYGSYINANIEGLNLVCKTPIYGKLVGKQYATYDELIARINAVIEQELANPTLRLYKDGNEITSLASGSLSAWVDTRNIEVDCVVIVATYNADNVLLSVGMEDFSPGADDVSIELGTVDFGADASSGAIKLFVFNNLDEIRPIDIYSTVTNLYVSPSGSDSGDGTIGSPFLTIARANQAVAQMNSDMTRDIVVNIEEGIYELSQTEVFDEAQSGTNGYNVIYRGVGSQAPTISGGKKVTGFEDIDGIWAAELSGVSDLRQLYVNGERAQRARSSGTYQVASLYDDPATASETDGFVISSAPRGSYAYKGDIELVFNVEWRCVRIPVKDIIVSGGNTTFISEQPAWDCSQDVSYAASAPGVASSFYVENAYEFLDEPGEFYFEKNTSTLFYIPRSGESINTAEAYIGTVETMFKVEGSSIAGKAKNIVFDNLEFKYGTYLEPNESGLIGGQATQIKVGTEDRILIPAQFEINKADNITVKNCKFSHLGSTAVSMQNAVTNSKILSNTIFDVSGSGISVGDPEHVSEMPAGMERCVGNLIYNNSISNIGNEFYQCPGITAYYVQSTTISHNYIKDTPYTGISLGWGWGLNVSACRNNEVSYNKIENVMRVLRDGGGIYTLGPMRNTVIKRNYIIGYNNSFGALYADQGSGFMIWSENVIDIGTSPLNKWMYIGKSVRSDLKIVNQYVTSGTIGSQSDVTPVETVVVSDGEWPAAAVAIINSAGIVNY